MFMHLRTHMLWLTGLVSALIGPTRFPITFVFLYYNCIGKKAYLSHSCARHHVWDTLGACSSAILKVIWLVSMINNSHNFNLVTHFYFLLLEFWSSVLVNFVMYCWGFVWLCTGLLDRHGKFVSHVISFTKDYASPFSGGFYIISLHDWFLRFSDLELYSFQGYNSVS